MNNFWLTAALLALGTFSIRASFIFFRGDILENAKVKKLLSFIPVAIFPALITPMAYFHEGKNEFLLGKERLLCLILASVVGFMMKSVVWTVLSGLVFLYLLSGPLSGT